MFQEVGVLKNLSKSLFDLIKLEVLGVISCELEKLLKTTFLTGHLWTTPCEEPCYSRVISLKN